MNDTNQVLVGVNMSRCECADILASVFPQLVTHWSAAGNKLKTFRLVSPRFMLSLLINKPRVLKRISLISLSAMQCLFTPRYMTESGAAALATANNMQALSYLHDAQSMLQKEGQDFVGNKEEKARVESLIGQVARARTIADVYHNTDMHESIAIPP